MSKRIIVNNCQECPYLTQVTSRTAAPYCLAHNRELLYTEDLDRGRVVKNIAHGIPEWCNLLEAT